MKRGHTRDGEGGTLSCTSNRNGKEGRGVRTVEVEAHHVGTDADFAACLGDHLKRGTSVTHHHDC